MSEYDPLHVADLFSQAGIDSLVIGGHAVNFHGYLRATEDVDIVFRRSSENDAKIFEILSSIHAFWLSDEIDPATRLEKTVPVSLSYIQQRSIMFFGSDFGYIDLFDFVPGLPLVTFDDLWRDRLTKDGRSFVSLEWLLKLKRTADRTKDALDVQNLSHKLL